MPEDGFKYLQPQRKTLHRIRVGEDFQAAIPSIGDPDTIVTASKDAECKSPVSSPSKANESIPSPEDFHTNTTSVSSGTKDSIHLKRKLDTKEHQILQNTSPTSPKSRKVE